MNTKQRLMAQKEAFERIANGEDPYALVHVIYYPGDYFLYDEEIMGLSSALPPGHDLGGYSSKYYTLEELACM